MYKQPTPDEYDLELLIAEGDAAIRGYGNEEDDIVEGEFITRKGFFKDLKKASQHMEKPKFSLKLSKT